MLNERSFETGRISIMRGSRRVLVKVLLFQLRGRGHPQNDAMPNIFPDSKSILLDFKMRYHLFLKSIGKAVKIVKTFFSDLAV